MGSEGLRMPCNLQSEWLQPTLEAPRSPSALWSLIIPHSRPPRVLSANEHMSSGELKEQLAAKPAICCCSPSGEEQVNALAASQSPPHPQCVYFFPRCGYRCVCPSVPQSLAPWDRDNRSHLFWASPGFTGHRI